MIQGSNIKDFPDYASPNKINKYISSREKFREYYVFKKRETTAAKERGNEFLPIVYKAITGDLGDLQIEKDFGKKRLESQVEALAKFKVKLESIEKEKMTEFKKTYKRGETEKLNAFKKEIKESSKRDLKSLELMFEEENSKFLSEEKYRVYCEVKGHLAKTKQQKLSNALKTVTADNLERTLICHKLKMCGIVDIIVNDAIIDIKTTTNAELLTDPSAFCKGLSVNYSVQNAIYTKLYESLFGRRPNFYYLAVLTKSPYGVRTVKIADNFLQDVEDALDKHVIPEYWNFVKRVEKSLGYSPFKEKDYKGDIEQDVIKLADTIGDAEVEVAIPPVWETKKVYDLSGY